MRPGTGGEVTDIYLDCSKILVLCDKFGKFTFDVFQSKDVEYLWAEIAEGLFEC